MKNKAALQWAALVLSILFAAGVQTVFRACAAKEDGTWMHCHEVQQILFLAGIVMAVLCAAELIIRNRAAGILLDAVRFILALSAVLLPGTVMKMCMMNTMRCYAVMQPFARIMGVLIAVLSLMDVIRLLRKGT